MLLAEKRPVRTELQPYLDIAEKTRSDETDRLDAKIKSLRAKLNDLPKPTVGGSESPDLQNQRKAIQKDIDETLAQRKVAVLAALEPAARDRLQVLESQVSAIDRKLGELPPPKLVYAGASFFEPQIKFVPAWTPRPVHLLQRGHERFAKGYCVALLSSLLFEPSGAADGEVCARWKGNHQIPIVAFNSRKDVCLKVRSRPFGREQIARSGVVSAKRESFADDAAEFAGDEDSHGSRS
jgi:hypothetical protein